MLKDQTIIVRTTQLETMALSEMAKREGLKRSEMLRFILRNAAKSAGVWPPVTQRESTNERQPV